MTMKQLPSSLHLLALGLMAASSLMLTGCTDRVILAEEKMAEIWEKFYEKQLKEKT